jgi:Flp pilus assembly protein TadD
MTQFLSYRRQQIVRQAFVSLTLVITTVIVYLPVRHYGFVNLDDNVFVTENPNLQDGLTWRSVRWAFTAGLIHHDPNADYWRPLSFLSHALDIEMFGLRPTGHHLMSVAIHATAVVALFLVLQSMTNAFWRCAFVAALFALHPLRVESVAWVTERKDVLSGLFFMLTLGAYVGYVRHPFSLARYLGVALLFASGLMSKSMVVTLPFVLLLLDYWPLGRTQWAKPAIGDGVTVPPNQLLQEKLPFFALAAVSGLVTLWGQTKPGGMGLLAKMPLGMRIANALLSYAGYIGKMLWPTGLAVWYPLHPGLSAAAVMGAGVGLIAVTAAVIWGARRGPWLVTGWFWYLGMLVPVIGLLQGGGVSMADRFTYLPLVGLFIMLCWSVPAHAMERWNLKVITCVAAAAVLVVCAALSRVQVEYWKDSEILFQHALNVTRDNWLAHNNLGVILQRAGKIQEAIGHYERALRIKPSYADSYINLGVALWQVGKAQEAIDHWEQALRIDPSLVEAHNNLGQASLQAGKFQEAIRHYEQALRVDPNYILAQNNLAWVLATLSPMEGGDPTRAVALAERVCDATGHHATAYLDTLAAAYAAAGRFSEAIAIAEQAVELAGTAGQHQLVREIETRLKSYRAGHAWRKPTASQGN